MGDEGTSTQARTKLARRWLIKMGVFIVICAGLSLWGLYDATDVYPARGERDASYKLNEYLQAASRAGRLTRTALVVEDPRAAHAELGARKAELATGSLERARYEWLESLARMWRLDSANDRIEDSPRAQLTALEEYWTQRDPPAPLEAYDLFFQWAIFVISGIGALLLLVLLARVARKSYRFDADENRLHLPGGRSVTPDDLAEVDKTKWHKFFVTLRLKEGAPVTLDLYRYEPLEEWVLAMEKIAFPELVEAEAKKEAEKKAKAEGAPADPSVGADEKEKSAPAAAEEGGAPSAESPPSDPS